ncbi:hypothetical protein [Nannocystis radixulma]|uniref:SH3 domain-containing protein n=1 Tax=Nannocystis radixulma TaxID=2995305 RepID=A0ABT5BH06_9BACT|nr:hypothetical protein [Nannocystis radixulma]MDC0672322.1 hypothetical protein [Nannocystis radixulma]
MTTHCRRPSGRVGLFGVPDRERRHVTAGGDDRSWKLQSTAPSGPAIDTLKGGTHFEVTSNAGGNWVHGYSYSAQKSGWLQNGWFC